MFGDSYNTMLGEALTVPPPLAIGDVRHVGDPIALVVAESRYVAEDACDLIEVDLDVLPPVVDYASAAADTDNLVHGSWGLESNAMVAMPFMPLAGDLDEAFAGAAHVVELTVEQNRYIPVPMETRGIVASYVPGREQLDIVCATQSVHETRNFFARYLGIPEGSVHVTANDVGGGFGQKMFVFREECAVVLASRLLARPVKWIEDRRENLVAASALAQRARVRADGDRRRGRHPGDHGRARRRRRRVPAVPRGHGPDAAAGAVQDPAHRVLDPDGVDQHHGQGRLPRAVDVRDDRARDGHRLRGTPDRHGSGRVPAQEPARVRRPAVHRAVGQRVPGDHPARDARPGARDARLRRVPPRADRGARGGPATSGSASPCTSSPRP